MTYNILDITNRNDVLVVTISREKALNALNRQTIDELEYFFNTALLDHPNAKGIVLTGAGTKAFVAGADIKEFTGLNTDSAARLAKRGQDVFFLVENFPKVVVAAVNGFALGGGCELAMACHIRLASDNARFGQPEVNLGIIPGYGGTQRLAQLVGKGKAMELILTADMVKADEAHRIGLANHVYPPDELIDQAVAMIEKIGSKGPLAVTKSIQAINALYDHELKGYEVEVEAFGHVAATEDFKEGVAAFVEKRAAAFKGR